MCAIFGFTSPSLKKEQILPYFEKTNVLIGFTQLNEK